MKALEIIKIKRKEKDISQDEMADKLQMARSTYQAIESGKNKMNIKDFFEIVKILEIPLTTFSEKEILIIEKEDLNNLIYHTREIEKTVNKIKNSTIQENTNNITIGSNNTIKNSFNKK